MRFRKTLQYYIEYIAARGAAALVKKMPATGMISCGSRMGSVAALCMRSRIRLARKNLQIAFGDRLSEQETETVINKLCMLLGEAVVEEIIFSGTDLGNIAIEGMDHVHAALANGRGALILVPHFGLWELSSFVFGHTLNNASVIYKALKNPYLDTYLVRSRTRSGLKLIPSKNALRMVLGELKKGRAVGLLFDQNAGKAGLPVPFFGKTASTYSAPAGFALKTGCAVLPAYMMKEPGFRKHRLTVGQPFELIQTGDRVSDLLANTRQYNQFLEQLVSRHPEQWFGWLHNRWKEPSSYAVEVPAQGKPERRH